MLERPPPHIPFVVSGSYPVRTGNLVRPLVDGDIAFRRICEAVDQARHSVWVTAAFVGPDVQLPGGRGSVFDVLERAANRGLDVRVLFWRPNPGVGRDGQTFPGSSANHHLLRARGSRFLARWDRAHGAFCQHQKSWLIDAGQPSETAFVGGINLSRGSIGAPGHMSGDPRHDAYVEVTGPSATDVHHNFVQRWNEASERGGEDGVWRGSGAEAMRFPTRVSDPQGTSLVQIQRTVHPSRYSDRTPSPGGQPYDIAGGERSIFEQYKQAIDAARSSIYIETLAPPVLDIAVGFEAALKRGVDVVVLIAAEPEGYVRLARRDPARKAEFDQLGALGKYETFALVGIAARNPNGGRSNIHVHSKIMLVDDAWATIGSCNLHAYSLFGHTEMNAAFWDPTVVRALRRQLLAEHLGQDTAHLDDRAALDLYRRVARENRRKRDAGSDAWQGLAFSLDPATYGA
jgi:cardiolipin synthase